MPDTLTISIPRTLVRTGDLIAVPRREYERLRRFATWKEFNPSPAQKRALLLAERNLHQGRTLSYHELVRKVGTPR